MMCIFFKKILKMFLWMFLETKRINSEDDCIRRIMNNVYNHSATGFH